MSKTQIFEHLEITDAKYSRDTESNGGAGSSNFATRDEAWHAYTTKQLVRKIDWHLLPWIVLMYLTNFLDRNALSQAKLGTLEKDLKLHGTQFNLLTSILFIARHSMFSTINKYLLTFALGIHHPSGAEQSVSHKSTTIALFMWCHDNLVRRRTVKRLS